MRRGRIWILIVVAVLLPVTAGASEPAAPTPGAGDPGGVGPTSAAPVDAEASYRPWEARPGRGGFVEFGARLGQRRPDRLDTCRSLSGGQYGSCSWEAINFGTGESFQPPLGSGRITQVRVRVGTRGTGPMRVEVLRAFRPTTPTGRVCCVLRARSPVFTPRQGGVTTVNVNLPVFQSRTPTPQGFYIDDRLALTVLRGDVPIPASLDTGSTTSLSGWFPGWARVGQERFGTPAGFSGAMVLLRARWRPA